jgi:hypothetical protein
LKIIIITSAVAIASILLYLITYRLTILLLLILGFGMVFLHVVNHRILLTLLYRIEMQDEEDIDKYAVIDMSFPTSEEEDSQ